MSSWVSFFNAFFKTWQGARIFYVLWYQSPNFWRQERYSFCTVSYCLHHTAFGFLAYNSLHIIKSYGIVSLTLKTSLNDTHMEELDSLQKSTEIQGWLLLTLFICLHN